MLPYRICKVSISFVVLILGYYSGHATILRSNGGYSITIAIEESTPEPHNSSQYIGNIQTIFQLFSAGLFRATKQKFHVNSVDLLIPKSWSVEARTIDVATTQSYQTADVRIFPEVDAPRVNNPNACGTAGLHIELPLLFFDNVASAPYGVAGKTLINLWARLRYGVHEENGYPDSLNFPYIYQKPSLDPKWEATGCSSTELSGKFFDRSGNECLTDPPGKDCRFEPTGNNTAISSLLHFYWINSITEFCDLRTHTYSAPNRQNFLCGSRSVWDVIKETADFRKVYETVEKLPTFVINVVKESPKPLFYVLIDNGRTSYPVEVLREISSGLKSFFGADNNLENIAGIGSYPNLGYQKSSSYIKEHVIWTPISSSSYDDFMHALDDLSSTREGVYIRDFGAAIQEVVEDIKLRNHKAGAVIVVVKKGAAQNTFGRLSYEEDLISSLNEQTNIKVSAIELQESSKAPYTNLYNLVQQTGGEYFLVDQLVNIGRKLVPFIDAVKAHLQNPIINLKKFRTIVNQATNANEAPVEIPVLEKGFISLQIHLTTTAYVLGHDIELKQQSGTEMMTQTVQRSEWVENVDAGRRTVHSTVISHPEKGSIWTIKYVCQSTSTQLCTGLLVVYGEVDEPSSQSIFSSDSVNIIVSTSADEGGYVDMSHQFPKPVPFAVYARVEINGQPVLKMENVQATIRRSDSSQNWKIPLYDDGYGVPDAANSDGVYSNIFTPLVDGLYRVSVVAYFKTGGKMQIGSSSSVSGVDRIMPVSQNEIGCYNSTSRHCIPADPKAPFIKVASLSQVIMVDNAETFSPGKPVRITDFAVKVLPNFRVIFSFTSPKLLGSDESPEEFLIFMAPSPNNYLGSTELTKNIVRQIGSPSGTLVEIPYYTVQRALPYYAVEVMYKNLRSGPSNVVGVDTETQSSMLISDTTNVRNGSVTTPFLSESVKANSVSGMTEDQVLETASIQKSFRLNPVHITYIVLAVCVAVFCGAASLYIIYKQRRNSPTLPSHRRFPTLA